MKLPAPLAYSIVVLVSLVWAGNFVASVFLPSYHSDTTLSFVFMTVVGGALALKQRDDEAGPGLLARLLAALRRPPPPASPDEEEQR